MAKQINTRIQLKYDSYENWTKAPGMNLVLGAGEIGLCAIPSGSAEATTAPTVLFKVGDGTNAFSALKWGSALAADVHEWAKKDETAFIAWMNEKVVHPTIPDGFTISASATDDDVVIATLTGGKNSVTGNFAHAKKGPANGFTGSQVVTSINAAGQSITIKVPKLTVDAYGHTNAVEEIAYEITIPAAVVNTITELSKGTGISITDDGSDGNHNYTVALDVDGAKTALGLKALAYKDSLAKGDVGLGNVDNTADADKPVSTLQQKAIDDALAAAKKYADDNDANTAHTHSAGVGLAITGDGGISGNVEYSANLDVKYEDSLIYLVDKTSGAKIGNGFDASEFVKDSYLKTVSYDAATNILTFTFVDNEDNLQAIPVDLTDLVDVYTADEASLTKTGSEFSIKDAGVTTAKIADKNVTEEKLEQDVQDALALARTALQSHQDISGKKDKQTAVGNQITKAAHVLSSLTQNENGNIAYEVKELAPADIGAQPAGNYKTVQETKDYAGSTAKTVTNVTQDANGVVTVTYEDIAFPEVNIPVGSGAVAIATEADGVVTLNGGVKLNDHTLEDDASKSDITLAKVATTGSTDDLEGGEEVWVFYCGNASTDVLEATMVPNNAGGTTAII